MASHSMQHNNQQNNEKYQADAAAQKHNCRRLQIGQIIGLRKEIIRCMCVPRPRHIFIVTIDGARCLVAIVATMIKSVALQVKWNATVIPAQKFGANKTICEHGLGENESMHFV